MTPAATQSGWEWFRSVASGEPLSALSAPRLTGREGGHILGVGTAGRVTREPVDTKEHPNEAHGIQGLIAATFLFFPVALLSAGRRERE